MQRSFRILTVGVVSLGLLPVAEAQVMCRQVFATNMATAAIEREAAKTKRPESNLEKLIERSDLAWKGGFTEKTTFLQTVHAEMNYSFPGREKEIARIMAAVKAVVLWPNTIRKPIVIDLFGFPGDGKTAMVNTLAKLLSLKSRSNQVNVKDGQIDIPLGTFRALSDSNANEGQAPVSFLIVDEWQKLRKSADLSSEGRRSSEDNGFVTEKNRDYSVTVDEVAQRRQFVRLMYDIYGNGTEKSAPTKKFESYLSELRQYVETIQSDRESLNNTVEQMAKSKKSLEEATDDASKKTLQNQIKNNENTVKHYQNIMSQRESGMRASVREFQKDYRDLLGLYGEMTPRDFTDQFINSRDTVVETLREMAENGSGYQREFSYKKMITFLLGNPEQTIKEHRKHVNELTVTDDQHRQSVMSLDTKHVQKELFEDIFGLEAAGLRQRLNVDQWGIMLPLGSNEWNRFLDRQIEQMQLEFKNSIEGAGLGPITLTIDQTVKDLLYSDAIVPTEGARVYFERANSILGNFFSDLDTRIIEAPEEVRPDRIMWGYNTAQRDFVVIGSKNSRIVLKERAAIGKVGNALPQQEMNGYDHQRFLANKAGQIVTGMALFGSLPTSFRLESDRNDWSLADLWIAPDKPRYSNTVEYIRIALGSNSAQNLMSDGFISMSDASLKFSHEMLRRLVEDLRNRERLYSYAVSRNEQGQKVYSDLFPRPKAISAEVFEALKEAADAREATAADGKTSENAENIALNKALALLQRDVQRVLQQNRELIGELVRLMDHRTADFKAGKINSPEITSTDLQLLVQSNALKHESKPKWWGRMLFIKYPDTSLLITPARLKQAEGKIEAPDHPFFRENDRAFREGSWSRLWRKFFGKPLPQRPLSSQ